MGRSSTIDIIVVLLFAALLSACGSDEVHLTAPTSEGAHTFSCLVKGAVWVADTRPLSGRDKIFCSFQDTYLLIKATRQNGEEIDHIDITVDGSESIVAGRSYRISECMVFDDREEGLLIYEKLVGESAITITLINFDRRFIAGTFAFNAVNDSGDTVRVTDGRFDVRF